MKTKIKHLFRMAAGVIRQRGWCSKCFLDDDGRVCLDSALRLASGGFITETPSHHVSPPGHPDVEEYSNYIDCVQEVRAYVDFSPQTWNDKDGRTEEQILDLLDGLGK